MTTQRRRDTPALVMASVATALLIALAIWMITIATWWSIAITVLAGLLLIVFAYGITESAQQVPRDEKGKRIKS